MIYSVGSDATAQLGVNFFCANTSCEKEDVGRYQGLIATGEKSIWLCPCPSCSGILTYEQTDKENPLKSIVRQILMNAAARESSIVVLWDVLSDFVNVSRDLMRIRASDIIAITKKSPFQPFIFMGYLAKVWLPLVVPTRVGAKTVMEMEVEHSECGIILKFHDIHLGVFESVKTEDLYTAAYYIETEIKKHKCEIEIESDEPCSPQDVSISGIIDYLDRMLFELGSPLEEIHTITKLLATLYLESERDEQSETLLRKVTGVLWLLKDGLIRQDVEMNKLKRTSSLSAAV